MLPAVRARRPQQAIFLARRPCKRHAIRPTAARSQCSSACLPQRYHASSPGYAIKFFADHSQSMSSLARSHAHSIAGAGQWTREGICPTLALATSPGCVIPRPAADWDGSQPCTPNLERGRAASDRGVPCLIRAPSTRGPRCAHRGRPFISAGEQHAPCAASRPVPRQSGSALQRVRRAGPRCQIEVAKYKCAPARPPRTPALRRRRAASCGMGAAARAAPPPLCAAGSPARGAAAPARRQHVVAPALPAPSARPL
ncbi:hypothetical protein PsYK624_031290 [Phanerochaete sordida]|uniref:Uncharacterized protein n=1 Tax=Phanerochaete sordida TaxID=48140 RepID=A0A9P3G2I3_9APHY|nr:hypothetical protein PsYK624_031290 [Phanerochaete sordida]